MRRSRIGHVGLGVALGLWMAIGCAKPSLTIPTAPAPKPQQQWMFQASGVHLSDTGPVFLGIGQATGLRNMSLLRATADNQARSEMAWVLDGFVAALADAAGLPSEAEADQQPIRQLTRTAMQQARIVDHWYEPASGTFKALCRLELNQLKQILQRATEMDAPLRQRMLSLTEQVHHQMATQGHP